MSTRVADFRLQDWLPWWLGVDDLIGALAALAVLVALIGVYNDDPLSVCPRLHAAGFRQCHGC